MTRLLTTFVAVLAVMAAPAAQQPSQPAPPAPSQPPAPRAGAPSPSPVQGQPPAFRGGIDLVSLNVTVTDSTGRYITDLAEADFQVFESGAKQTLTVFNRRQNPIALSLLLDSSASMEYKLPTLQAAASNFVQRLKPNDIAEVVDFDGSYNVRQAFTSNHADLERGIHQMSAGGSTALHNAIYTALKGLKKVQLAVSDEEARRQALIVFSDGQDTSSLVMFDDLLDLAKRSETAIYTIGLRDTHDQARGFSSSEFVLRQLALETGGKSFFPANIADLSNVYGQIADELASQYSIGYVSSNQKRDGAWRPIVVQVTRQNLTTRTKKGYYAPSASSR
ncbi:MAG TPA: VWA domain-containing protein [Vicinamibacterales bacterium]|nr:VWA domain-containing protein [Vicinamibacterales bacterium]